MRPTPRHLILIVTAILLFAGLSLAHARDRAGFVGIETSERLPARLLQTSPQAALADSDSVHVVVDTTSTPADSLFTEDNIEPGDTTYAITEVVEEELEPLEPIVPPDTTSPPPYTPVSFRLTNREWHRHTFRESGDVLSIAPGYFPRNIDLYGQPFYLVPPGGTPRDIAVRFRGRSFDDPVTGSTNFATFVPEEIRIAEYEPAATSLHSSSGPMIRLIAPYVYEATPRTRIVYRQGWYGTGRADWRISQQLTNSLAYHAGVNIAEFQGRYENTVANTSHIRFGARRTFRNIGHLELNWMEMRDTWGEAFDNGHASLHRNDVDLRLFSGAPGDSVYRETGLWYVRSQYGYGDGDEDGNRLGFRIEQGYGDLGGHNLLGRVDVERVAARFPRRLSNIDPQAERLTAGISLRDRFTLDRLTVQGSVRAEFSRLNVTPDTVDLDDDLLAGGSVSASYRLIDSLRVQGIVSSSWRYPGLDESAGYWSVRTPNRWMDLLPVPDFTTYYRGNPALEPVKTEYAAAGLAHTFEDYRQVYVMSGLRQWRDQILPYSIDDDNWSRRNVDTYTSYETTAYAWTPIWGPVSLAASWTYAEPLTANAPVPDNWGWVSARFMDFYYNGQLRIRATVSARYWGGYESDELVQDDAWLLDGLINVKIFDFEAYYGVQNTFGAPYQFIPGYPNLHRTELWGVRWVLFK